MSFVEMLVASAVLALLLMLAYEVLLEGLRYYRESQAKIDTQRDAIRILVALGHELRETSYRTVSCQSDSSTGSGPAGVIFGSARSSAGALMFDATGNPVWRRYICYMRQDSRLFRYETDNPQADDITPNTFPDGLNFFVATPPAATRCYSQGVSFFNTSRSSSGGSHVKIELTTSALSGRVTTRIENKVFTND